MLNFTELLLNKKIKKNVMINLIYKLLNIYEIYFMLAELRLES